jgi:hypothetical protein
MVNYIYIILYSIIFYYVISYYIILYYNPLKPVGHLDNKKNGIEIASAFMCVLFITWFLMGSNSRIHDAQPLAQAAENSSFSSTAP